MLSILYDIIVLEASTVFYHDHVTLAVTVTCDMWQVCDSCDHDPNSK